jgi:hypothetical protein
LECINILNDNGAFINIFHNYAVAIVHFARYCQTQIIFSTLNVLAANHTSTR